MELQIAAYEPVYRDQVIGLLRLNTPEHFAAEEEQELMDYLDHKTERYYVMLDGIKVVGCGGINFSADGSTATISWDIIHPGWQGSGLGGRLTQYRIAVARGMPSIQRMIVRTSQMAYRFYEKQGFRLKSIEKDYWAAGYNLYHMEMELLAANAY